METDVYLRLIAMHAQKVLLDVVGAVELLLADIAVEGLLVAVNVLVAREQIPSVCSVRTSAAHVAFAGVAGARARARSRATRRRVARCGTAAAALISRLLHLDYINLLVTKSSSCDLWRNLKKSHSNAEPSLTRLLIDVYYNARQSHWVSRLKVRNALYTLSLSKDAT